MATQLMGDHNKPWPVGRSAWNSAFGPGCCNARSRINSRESMQDTMFFFYSTVASVAPEYRKFLISPQSKHGIRMKKVFLDRKECYNQHLKCYFDSNHSQN